ncbi:hypothetical protein Tco_0824766 [Tanacetum coccineum]|uniref:Synaptobrevin, longin-like domain protein n=1 Tax=Tanacetum coccineum TaxID=301880 RepID=A0ABQ5AQ36_9ASTR
MVALESCPKHNMVAYLEKTEGNAQFHEIFWNSVVSQTVSNVSQIKTTISGQTVLISESSIRRDLLFNDDNGIDCLTVADIYENLPLIGYEGDLTILTFQKALFSPQWKYLIHTIIHCLNSKSTSWDQFPINVASAVICLATDRKFNFSKMIFDGQVTPLFPNMLASAEVEEGEGSEQPTEPQPTPSPTQPSIGDPTHVTESSSRPKNTHSPSINLEGTGGSEGDQVQLPNDSPHSGGNTSERAEEILKLKTKIKKLEKKCKPSISHHRAWLRSVSILSMKEKLGKKESVSKQGRKNAKPGPTLDDSAFDDLDADLDHTMEYMDIEEAVNKRRQSNDTEEAKCDT